MVFDIPNTMMTLATMKTKQKYKITGFIGSQLSAEELERMQQHGLVVGTIVRLLRSAPIFKDPILIEIDKVQLAISKFQAKAVSITEAIND